jgi:uncharacterized Zn-binding protein involved in type VI secretion
MSTRNCWDGKGEGLHGDRTTTGAFCYSGYFQVSNAGLGALRIGDRTSPCPKCGEIGEIIEGHPWVIWDGKAVAVDGALIYCGCPKGANRLIAPAGQWMGKNPPPQAARAEPIQHAQLAKRQNGFADTCTPEDNALLNGVYIWTETKNAGHAFVSVHENNNIYLYTYGRYGRTDTGGFTGDGILNFLLDEDARVYYRSELYVMGSRVFRIDDADPAKTRKFFEDLWNSSKPAIQTSKMPETTKSRGHTIDGYDVTGSNCATHSVAGVKFAGSTVFKHGYTSTTTQLPIDAEEDFTVPVSLQRFLIAKGGDISSMLVVEMTNAFKEQYPNSGNLQPFQENPGGKFQHIVADGAAIGDSLSPYSGGTVGGLLGGSYDK